MKRIPDEDFQPLLLDMLKSFQRYCQCFDIAFFASCGTALGAVRHKGFIPWDDDIDLFIYKRDLQKFISIAKENPYLDTEKRYKILLPGVLPNYYPFFKIVDTKTVVYEKNVSKKYSMGIWIDLFVMSFWDDNNRKAYKQYTREKFFEKMNQLIIGGDYCYRKYKFMELFAAPIRAIFLSLGMNSEYWCKKILKNDYCALGSYVGNVCWPYAFEKERFRAEWFEKLIYVPFEDTSCPIPKDYDLVLSCFYGDYLTPPPEGQRVRHNPEAYYLD